LIEHQPSKLRVAGLSPVFRSFKPFDFSSGFFSDKFYPDKRFRRIKILNAIGEIPITIAILRPTGVPKLRDNSADSPII
ncbi:hypothetical protein, partial [Carboxylicivirga caseinilyticus]|uniref:hypothetical protein n=1 Tax=Carboxylicivirga caseinilyticus TaxID=3417572 RepID=UPI003D33BB7A|nr:hypothetical protein [Marinilabiliaceae bacterium A049]